VRRSQPPGMDHALVDGEREQLHLVVEGDGARNGAADDPVRVDGVVLEADG